MPDRPARPALRALFALDGALAQVLRTTREPMVGQMRLTWWHEALTRLDASPPPAEPVLQSLAREALPRGVTGAGLAGMIDGWEELLEPELLGDDALIRHATGRGSRLFEMAGKVIGASETDPVAVAGKGWALADLGRHLSDRVACRACAGACRGADRGGDARSLESRRPAAGRVDAYRANEPCRAARSTSADRCAGPRRAHPASSAFRPIVQSFATPTKPIIQTLIIQGRGLCGAMLRVACRWHFSLLQVSIMFNSRARSFVRLPAAPAGAAASRRG